jgi:DNA polymerase-3 subunit alpha
MAAVTLDDRTGRMEVTVFPDLYEQVRELLTMDRLLAVAGTLSFGEYRDSWSLRAAEVHTLEQAREAAADHLLLDLDLSDPKAHAGGAALAHGLRDLLAGYRGGRLPVHLAYRCPGAGARLVLDEAWRVQPSDELLRRLRQLLGPESVHVSYERFVPPREPAPARERPPRLALVR